jgi:outer membrane protein TolC
MPYAIPLPFATPQRGYAIELPVPLLDWGEATRSVHRARLRAAEHALSETTRHASSQLREASHAYAATYAIAKHYRDDIVPLRKTIADEMLLKYNGMLIGVFELLADARDQINSVIQAIDAQRDFWLADAHLKNTHLGTPSASLMLDALPTASSGDSKGH